MNVKPLIEFAEGEAYCPCCEGVYMCEPGCTIAKDVKRGGIGAGERYQRMIAARKALAAAGIKQEEPI